MTPGRAGPGCVVLVLGVLLAGCSGAATPTSATAPHRQTDAGAPLVAVKGGTVTIAVDDVPTTLNDHTVQGDTPDTEAVCSLIWPQVFQVAPGQSPQLDTDVVDDAEVVSVNPQTVVYQIDPRAEWSDGTPVNAQDFVYAWLSQSGTGQDVDGSPDSVASSAGYSDISSVVGSNGGKTVTVTFTTPYADWESLFDDLLPAHIAENIGWNSGFNSFDPSALVSGGPWMVSAWTPGQSMVLVHNPHWWGKSPGVNELVLRTEPGAPSLAQSLADGQVQVAAPSAFGPSFEAAVSSAADLESSVSLGTTILQLVFDTKHAPLDDADVRQGIAHALDRADMVTTLLQPMSPLLWEDNDHLFANTESWYTDDAAGYEQPDPVAATRALEAGGLVADPHGTWTWHGSPLQLTLAWATDDPWSALVGPTIAAQLVAAGFDVVTEPTTSAELLGSVLPSGNFDLALAPLPTGAFPSQLASAFGDTPGEQSPLLSDWSGFDDPRIDSLFSQASQQLAAAQDRQLYQQIDNALWSAMPTLPLFAEPDIMVWSASLSGVKADAGGLGPLWSASDWSELAPAPTGASATRARPGAKRS